MELEALFKRISDQITILQTSKLAQDPSYAQRATALPADYFLITSYFLMQRG